MGKEKRLITVALERSLSLWQVTLMGVGVILGAGIYVIIGEAVGLAGNAIWLSFLIGAIVATFSGLSYAELSSRYPKAGAEYSYVKDAFGGRMGWVTGWLIILSYVIAGATVSLGFAMYFSALFSTPLVPVAIILILLCSVILYAGVQETATLTIIFMIVESLGLFIIIGIGITSIGTVNYLEMADGARGVVSGGVLIFFSYLGFQGITTLAEETKNPEKTIPKAIMLAILITTIIYILVGITAVSIVPWQELSQSSAPLALIAERVFGEQSFVILSCIALFSTFNTVLISLLSGSRLVYGISKGRGLPEVFARCSKKLLSPYMAIITVGVMSVVVLFLGDLAWIANLTNFTVFTVFIIINVTLIYLRIKRPVETGFRIPFNIKNVPVISVLGVLTSLFMLSFISVDIMIAGIILIVVGIIFALTLDKLSNYVYLEE